MNENTTLNELSNGGDNIVSQPAPPLRVEPVTAAPTRVDVLVVVATPPEQASYQGAITAAAAFTSSLAGVSFALAVPGDGTAAPPAISPASDTVPVHTYTSKTADPILNGLPQVGTYSEVLPLAEQLGARATLFVSNELVPASAVRALVSPVLQQNCDLALPRYAMAKFDGLLNTGVLSPMASALYGRRSALPLPREHCVSLRMLARLAAGARTAQSDTVPWPYIEAVVANLNILECGLGFAPTPHAEGAADLTAVLTTLVGSLFQYVDRTAATWQKIRGVQPLSTVVATQQKADERAIDTRPLRESFQLGQRNLGDVWSLVLPPVTLVELKRLSTASSENFVMPDAVWARTLYDFSLAWRLRTLSRTHLMGALVPLYLGWVASYVQQVSSLGNEATQQRLDALVTSFEQNKPYLVSRWRWPDRFNP